MLTLPEKILFVVGTLAALYAGYRVVQRILGILRRGQGKPDWGLARKRLLSALAKTITLQPTFRLRLGTQPAPRIRRLGFHLLPAGQLCRYPRRPV